MKTTIGMLLTGMLFLATGVARAESGATAAEPKAALTASASPTAASAEVKAGSGYEKFAVTGEATSFPAGTLVFAVSTVRGAEGTTVRHIWKKDGAELWTASLNIGAARWTTSSRRLLNKAGEYEVSVVGADGSELGKVTFTIQ